MKTIMVAALLCTTMLDACPAAVSLPLVRLRKRSPPLREGLLTKDPCIFPATGAPRLWFYARFVGISVVRCRRTPPARNAQVLRLLSSGFAGRKTALSMTTVCLAPGNPVE
jgi:hypothetical protein